MAGTVSECNVNPERELPWLGSASRDEMARIVDSLYHVHRLITAIHDLDTLLLRIAQESRHVAGAEASSLLLYDARQGDMYFHIAIGESGDQERLKSSVRLKLGQGIAGTAAATRVVVNVRDVTQDTRFFRDADTASSFRTRNLLAIPMVDRDQLIGVLEVVNKVGEEAFTVRDEHVMEMFSSLAASAVVNARLIEEQVRRERLAAIGEAMTALSHDTKNIINGLSTSAELIDMGLTHNNVQVLQKAWPVFKRSTKRIGNFVQDMLSFSKPRAPMREHCNVSELIEEARDTAADFFARKSAQCVVDASGVSEAPMLDSQAMYRSVLNLLCNAVDAVPASGGVIRVTAKTDEQQGLHIEIADNGPGVPADYRQQIFDPFFSTKGSHGTGLGLAVAQKTVQEHGGTLTIGDAPEGGALFIIGIPART